MSKIFTLTAPSGAGKTTLAQSIAKYGDWTECISHTTRPMRDGEIDGKTYYFISDEEFASLNITGKLAENVEYNGYRYGITKGEIERVMKTGRDVFIIVEDNGYTQIKQQYPDAVGIFLYMSKEDCMANMLLRGDKLDYALSRIKLYDKEIKDSISYEYVIKNVRDKQYETVNIIRAIIRQYRNDKDVLYVNTSPMPIGKALTNGTDTIYSDKWG